MNLRRRRDFVLSVFATTRGFAFTLFEGPLTPVDWGVKELAGADRNARCVQEVAALAERYRPDVLVIEDYLTDSKRRAERIARLYQSIDGTALANGITVCRYTQAQVAACFEHLGARTKHQRATLIARHIPAFAYKVPPERKPWKSTHPRMGLFDAAALNLTYHIREAGERLGPVAANRA